MIRKTSLTILIIFVHTFYSCNSNNPVSDSCTFNEIISIAPVLIDNDSIKYYYLSIPIDNYNPDNIYSCIIGEFDTIKHFNSCELKTIGSYDSIPNEYIKDSSFVTMYNEETIKSKVISGFIRIENNETEKYRIFRIAFNEND